MQRKAISRAHVSNGLLATLCLFPFALSADPWGKDADLSTKCFSCQECVKSSSPLSVVGDLLIRFHQEVISPADGPRSHFKPSSSQYTRDAMAKYGFLWGVVFGCDRLMRENDDAWIYRKISDGNSCLKFNPVP